MTGGGKVGSEGWKTGSDVEKWARGWKRCDTGWKSGSEGTKEAEKRVC